MAITEGDIIATKIEVVEEFCQCCLSIVNLNIMQATNRISENLENYFLMLEYAFAIQIRNQGPMGNSEDTTQEKLYICTMCIEKLRVACEFKALVEKTQELILKAIEEESRMNMEGQEEETQIAMGNGNNGERLICNPVEITHNDNLIQSTCDIENMNPGLIFNREDFKKDALEKVFDGVIEQRQICDAIERPDDSLSQSTCDIPPSLMFDREAFDKDILEGDTLDKQISEAIESNCDITSSLALFDKEIFDKDIEDDVFDKDMFEREVYDKSIFEKNAYEKKSFEKETDPSRMCYSIEIKFEKNLNSSNHDESIHLFDRGTVDKTVISEDAFEKSTAIYGNEIFEGEVFDKVIYNKELEAYDGESFGKGNTKNQLCNKDVFEMNTHSNDIFVKDINSAKDEEVLKNQVCDKEVYGKDTAKKIVFNQKVSKRDQVLNDPKVPNMETKDMLQDHEVNSENDSENETGDILFTMQQTKRYIVKVDNYTYRLRRTNLNGSKYWLCDRDRPNCRCGVSIRTEGAKVIGFSGQHQCTEKKQAIGSLLEKQYELKISNEDSAADEADDKYNVRFFEAVTERPVVVWQSYTYCNQRIIKNGMTLWVCCNKNCSASVKTKGKSITEHPKEHTCIVPEKPLVSKTTRKTPLPYKLEKDINNRECQLCQKVFSCFKELQSHMHEHFPKFKCEVCGKPYSNASTLRGHINRTHAADQNQAQCSICSKTLKDNFRLQTHMRLLHEGERMMLKCKDCPRTFTHFQPRFKHMVEEHGYIPYTCSECNREFYSCAHLRVHVHREHVLKKRFKCDLCGFDAITTKELNDHRVIHKGKPEYKCDVCARRYTTKRALVAHMKQQMCTQKIINLNSGMPYRTKRLLF